MGIADWFKRHKWLIKERPGFDEGDADLLHGQAGAEQKYGLVGHGGLSQADDQPTADDIEVE